MPRGSRAWRSPQVRPLPQPCEAPSPGEGSVPAVQRTPRASATPAPGGASPPERRRQPPPRLIAARWCALCIPDSESTGGSGFRRGEKFRGSCLRVVNTSSSYAIVNLSPQASPSRHAALRGGARSPSRTPPAAPRTARAVSPRRASPSPRSTGCRRPGVVYGRCWYGDPMIVAPRPSRCEWPGHSNAAHGSALADA